MYNVRDDKRGEGKSTTQNPTPNDFLDPFAMLEQQKFKIIYFVCLSIAYLIFHFEMITFFFCIAGYIIVEWFLSKRSIKSLLQSIGILIGVLAVFELFGFWFGVIGVIIVYVIMTALTLYLKRDVYLNGMRHLETKIFGKPLEKKYWKEGELKEYKMRLKL